MTLPEVDRVGVTTAVDNDIDSPRREDAIAAMKHGLGDRLVVSSVGTTFTFAAPA